MRIEKKQYREKLKSSRKHIKHQYEFRQIWKAAEILSRSYKLKTGTDIVYCGGNRRKVCC